MSATLLELEHSHDVLSLQLHSATEIAEATRRELVDKGRELSQIRQELSQTRTEISGDLQRRLAKQLD